MAIQLGKSTLWGGFFERLVGSVKRCLRKVVGNTRLSRVKLETILVEIEGTLNNRPLTYSYDELREDMLMPAHLLYECCFEAIPDDVKDEEDDANSWLTVAGFLSRAFDPASTTLSGQ